MHTYLSNISYFAVILIIINPISNIDVIIKSSCINTSKTIEAQIIISSVLAAIILNLLSFYTIKVDINLLQLTAAVLLFLKAFTMLKSIPNEYGLAHNNKNSAMITPLLSPLLISPELVITVIFISATATNINQKISLIFLNTSAIFLVSVVFLMAKQIKINEIHACILTRFLGIITMFLAIDLLNNGIKSLYSLTNII
ncbi:MAG: hypothetical protein HON78_04525 [Legionellales bacterium]|jgi:small neutral amino acid transporter SnatA (MarC family)|nr:hypothetical protein [Legionellales bacterium]